MWTEQIIEESSQPINEKDAAYNFSTNELCIGILMEKINQLQEYQFNITPSFEGANCSAGVLVSSCYSTIIILQNDLIMRFTMGLANKVQECFTLDGYLEKLNQTIKQETLVDENTRAEPVVTARSRADNTRVTPAISPSKGGRNTSKKQVD